ncbi:flagellar hook-associated protein FlgK [Crenobacter cavernae]|uniref:Flagellar hook-associated protein 1 n=1 Tax=Crenobacter cavernae TaxID=2290923 RepID=A0A345Y7G7_9NEIS|nr:flagellar hook-associated protein FlgK [Crenobacter cavernae]AXK39869.1 flagellar hook-associated protein FlgK [Crenobacter cavernae]
MGSGIFGIAISGLNAARGSLETTSHNISNVNTAGYHRQVNAQTARTPFFEGYGYVGRGVDTTQVSRIYDRYLDRQLNGATALDGYYQTQNTFLSQIDNVVADQDAGLSPAMQDFFRGVQTLSANPKSIPARQDVINLAQSLAGRIQSLHGRFEDVRRSVNGQLQTVVESINAYSGQIADINQRILALNQGSARVPNDLLDQRDQMVNELNQLVKTDVMSQPDGSYSVFIGNGQGLVTGAVANKLTTVPNVDDPEQLDVAYSFGGGQVRIPNGMLDGGKMGALLNYRSETLNRVQADLGRLTISIADTMNRQHALGRDLNNQPGSAQLFTDLNAYLDGGAPPSSLVDIDGAPTYLQLKQLREATGVFSVKLDDPAKLAVGSSLKMASTSTPASLAYVSSVWQEAGARPQTLNNNFSTTYPAGVDLSYDTATQTFTAPAPSPFTVTTSKDIAGGFRLTDSAGVTIEFKLEGSPNNGEVFRIGARGVGTASVDAAPSDNANMLVLAKIQSQNVVVNTPGGSNDFVPADGVQPNANFQSFYGQLVSFVGSAANTAKVGGESQATTLKEVKLARESFSGVNLDEEAANLIRFQQAYQASSKVIQIAEKIFSDLLQLGG